MSANPIIEDAPPRRPVHLKVSTPADLVASLPYMFGFMPTDSLIVLALNGKTICAAARVDADVVDYPEQLRARLEAVVRHGKSTIIVGWIDSVSRAKRIVSLASAALGGVDQKIIVSCGRCQVDGGPWLDCPASLPEAEEAGLEVLPSRAAIARSVQGPGEADKAATRRWPVACSAVRCHDSAWRAVRFDELLARGLDKVCDLSVGELTELAALVFEGETRERVWDHFSAALAPKHQALWRAVVNVTARAGAAAPLGLLAMAAWLAGEGALATCCVQRGQRISPEHSLLRLIDTINLAGVPPTAWEQMQRIIRGG